MIRVAAIADLHCIESTCGRLAPAWLELNEKADLFLVGGDLTTTGTSAEATVLAKELSVLEIPVVAVLGNHDYHADNEGEVRRILEDHGVHVLEGESCSFNVNGESVGVAGIKGFGGGFAGACGSDFGEPEMKAYMRHTAKTAEKLRHSLRSLTTDYRLVLLHYAPIDTTLRGEPLPIYPFMGSYLFSEVIDELGADLVVHGHAHHGSEKGVTPGGIPVRNVAMPLIRHPYQLIHLEHTEASLPFPEQQELRGP
jgi:Icc-related predicted phosphoesterase